MKSTYHFLFFIRKTKPNKNGLCSVNMRITIDGQSREINTKIEVASKKWNPQNGNMNGRSNEAMITNQLIDRVIAAIKNHFNSLLDKNGSVTTDQLKNTFLGVNIKERSLITLFDKKIEQKKKLVDNTIRKATLSNYYTSKGKLTDFLKHHCKTDDIQIQELDYDFVQEYDIYLRSNCKLGHNMTVKHLRYLKQITSDAIKNRILDYDPFTDYPLSEKPGKKEFLIEPELKLLMNKTFQAKRLEEVRDTFLFSCFSNLVEKMRNEENEGNRLIISNECLLMSVSA